MSIRLRPQKKILPRPRRRREGEGAPVRLAGFVLRETGSLVAKLISFTALLALFLLIVLDGTVIVLDRLDPRLKAWLNDRIAGPEVDIGSVSFSLGEGENLAGLTLNDIRLEATENSPELTVPSIETGFSVIDTIRQGLRPRHIVVSGAEVELARGADGVLRLTGQGEGPGIPILGQGDGGPPDIPALLESLAAMQTPEMLDDLQSVSLTDVAFAIRDAARGRGWSTTGAQIDLKRDETGLQAAFRADLRNQADQPFAVNLTLEQSASSGETRVSAGFKDAVPGDIVAFFPALDWLDVLDARVDGSLAATVDADGAMQTLSGTLSLDEGFLVPGGVERQPFDHAQVYFTYDPVAEAFTIDALEIVSDRGALQAAGRIAAERSRDGGLGALVGELQLRDIDIRAPEIFAEELHFAKGALTARVTFAPFALDIGAASIRNDGDEVSMSGRVAAQEGGWAVALDAHTAHLDVEKGMRLWPETLRPKLRRWIAGHVYSGALHDARGFFRLSPGFKEIGLDFNFASGRFQPVKTMPPIVAARGTGHLVADRFDIVLDRGVIGAGPGAGIDISGSRMVVTDTRKKPADGEFYLTGSGPIKAFLELVDARPLTLLSQAGRDTDLAHGAAEVDTYLRLPLKEELSGSDIHAEVDARLSGVRSDRAVEGRRIEADRLNLLATRDALQIAGDIRFDTVPMTVRYARALKKDAPEPTTVEGRLAVTSEALDRLGIPIPEGAFSGTGSGQFSLALRPDAPPRYDARVGLAGADVQIAPLGWRKPAGAAGRLAVSGQLGEAPSIERFELSGPGLEASGTLALAERAVASADLDRLRLGNWLDAAVTWTPREGPDAVRVIGGDIDLRGGGGTGVAGQGNVEIAFAPDRLIVSDQIVLLGVDGRLTTGGGLKGRLRGKVNGGPQVEGVIRPGPEIFISSDTGGEVLRAAKVFSNAVGGTLRVRLAPVSGGLSGAFSLQDTRVVDAPVLADILNLASIVGIADRLGGPGIGFSDVQGRFRIVPGRIHLDQARAVGASLGVTLNGIFDSRRNQLAMEGVVSPLYMVNGLAERIPLFGRLLGGKPGEGLLGANFRLTGRADRPQVSVNPLSMLTPGATREIFQSRAATTPSQ